MSKVGSRADAIRRDIKNRDRSPSLNKHWYYLSEDDLKALNIKRYPNDSGERGKRKDHYLHILPASPKDGLLIGLKLAVHFNVGPNDSAYLCPAGMKEILEEDGIAVPESIANGRCPICERRLELWNDYNNLTKNDPSGDYAIQRDEAKSLFPRTRYIVWVINAKDEEAEGEGIHFLDAPGTLYNSIMDQCEDRRTGEVMDISDPKDGWIFIYGREGESLSTRYVAFSKEDREPIPDDWMDIPRFQDILVYSSYDEIASEFLGDSVDDDDLPPKRNRETKEEAEQVREDLGKEFEKGETRTRKSRVSRQTREVEDVENPVEESDEGHTIEEPEEKEEIANIRRRISERRRSDKK